jgi:cell fate regulator YaaT (PSP1 superfamily)
MADQKEEQELNTDTGAAMGVPDPIEAENSAPEVETVRMAVQESAESADEEPVTQDEVREDQELEEEEVQEESGDGPLGIDDGLLPPEDGETSHNDNNSTAPAGKATVIGVRFRTAGKVYYFSPGSAQVKRGSHVVVETARGVEYGFVVCSPMEIDRKKFRAPIKPIIRAATAEDDEREKSNQEKEREAFYTCQAKIRQHGLDMKLIDAEYTFDNNKILFYFTAEQRVDFRDLVKDLAGIFRTRIELRQIGVRDETKILGGYGICGRPLCCHAYLSDFVPVSIKMAKEQNLSLNPAKISGVCGRLMCCLKNEEETYEALNKTLPGVGDEVQGSDGLQGEVESVNVLRQRVRILVEVEDEKELHEYPAEEITILHRRKRGQSRPKLKRGEGAPARVIASASLKGRGREQGQNPENTFSGTAADKPAERSDAVQRSTGRPAEGTASGSDRTEGRMRPEGNSGAASVGRPGRRAERQNPSERRGQRGTRPDRQGRQSREDGRSDPAGRPAERTAKGPVSRRERSDADRTKLQQGGVSDPGVPAARADRPGRAQRRGRRRRPGTDTMGPGGAGPETKRGSGASAEE